MIDVTVAFDTRTGPIGARLFSRCAETVLRSEHRSSAALSFVLVDDAAIRRINARFLGHDYETDVITFPLEDEGTIEAEIYISMDTARRQAAEYRVPVRDEVARLAIHGVLHLCGYDDATEAQRDRMKAREEACLARVRQTMRKRS